MCRSAVDVQVQVIRAASCLALVRPRLARLVHPDLVLVSAAVTLHTMPRVSRAVPSMAVAEDWCLRVAAVLMVAACASTVVLVSALAVPSTWLHLRAEASPLEPVAAAQLAQL
jgi:hypothetical protein